MRVGVDVTPTISGTTGVARYTRLLVDGLRDSGTDVSAFAIGRGPGSLPPGTRHLRVPLRVVQRAWRLGMPLRAERLSGQVDLIHSTDLVLPPTRLPLVATVHDAAGLELPELQTTRSGRQVALRIAQLHRAAVVIANSQATADSIRRFVDLERVEVVPLAPYPLPAVGAAPPFIEGDYLLCVGEVTERKDHVTLVRAFAQAELGQTRLVIAGPPGSGSALLSGEIDRLGLGDRVVVAGRVDDLTLARLYAFARVLCLTSRQEGFGIPLVEAMRSGLPLVASDLPAIREVAGAAAILVPPTDVDGFARALEQAATDGARRDQLVAASSSRADLFGIDRMIQGHVAAYRRALDSA